MAKSSKNTPADDTPETLSGESTSPPPKKKPTGRPKQADRPFAPNITFFEKTHAIPKDDWGTRTWVYLYRLEPFTDRLRSGTTVFVLKYAEPIDETRILIDHGSGRYRAVMTHRKDGDQKSDEIARHEFELLNLKFPPKVPKGEWLDDPRNKKWEWARNFNEDGPTAPPPPSATDSAIEHFRVYNEIEEKVAARNQAADPLRMIQAVKEILPPPTPPASENGMFNAVVQMMNTTVQQQGAIMQQQIAAAQAESKELRAELREMRNGPKTDWLSVFREGMKEVKGILPELKDFFPASEGRARGPWWAGTIEQLAAGAAPLLNTVGSTMFSNWVAKQNGGNGNAPPPANGALPPGQPQSNGARPPQAAPGIDLDSMLLSALTNGEEGDDFAHVLNTYYGEQGKLLYRQACSAGVDGLLTLLKGQPVWQRLGPLQEKMPIFIKQFVEYGQEPAPSDPNALDVDSEVIR